MLVDQNIGFRFDIYERIHLPEGTLAIRDLEEIELTPYFQGIPGNEQTQLRGNLQLTAVYQSMLEGAGKQTFIHRIPVEISLPVRTNDTTSQDIQVRIDQFDVELVSDRSLNVTGILSLAGWEQLQSNNVDRDTEEFYAEHEAYREQVEEIDALEIDRGETQGNMVGEVNQEPQEEALEEVQPLPNAGMPIMPEEQFEYWNQPNMVIDQMQDELLNQPVQDGTPNSNMKVAIKPQHQEQQAEDNESPTELPVKSEKANNSLEWKRLFLIKEETTQFKRLRLCIVQKEDTLQTIADRYELQPRELALYNRLGESDVSEGQVIYIPKANV